MSELTILKSEAAQAFSAVLSVGREFAEQAEEARIAGDVVAEALVMSFGMVAIQDAILANKESIKVLGRHAGHKWGFKTDQDRYDGSGSTYDAETVVNCFCEAMLSKLKPIGNEFNIIQSSCYTTKEGWTGKLSRLPGVTEIDARPGAIVDFNERDFTTKKGAAKKKITAVVSATADCKVWGQLVQVRAWKDGSQDERFQLSVIADEIDEAIDQLRGKADARIMERLYMKCVGLSLLGPDDRTSQVLNELPAITAAPVTKPPSSVKIGSTTRKMDEPPASTSTPIAEPIPFAEQIEAATKSRDLDTIARAIKAANLPDDEFAFYKAMVTEARKRLTEVEVAT